MRVTPKRRGLGLEADLEMVEEVLAVCISKCNRAGENRTELRQETQIATSASLAHGLTHVHLE